MSGAERDAVVRREAVTRRPAEQLEDYLNDMVAPMQVAEAVLELLETEPKAANRIILQWADQQLNINLHAIPVSDFLYHALKKIQIFEELGLVEPKKMHGLIERTARQTRAYCPQDEIADFDDYVARLHEASRLFRTVDLLHRTGDEPEPEARAEDEEEEEDLQELRERAAQQRAQEKKAAVTPSSDEKGATPEQRAEERPSQSPKNVAELSGPQRRAADLIAARRKKHPDLDGIRQDQVALGLKRFSMLVKSLEQASDSEQREPWMPHLLSAAALGVKNYDEFRGYLERLKSLGLEELHMEQVFRSVAESMPDWHLAGESPPQPETAATAVMKRLVEISGDDSEKSDRLREIVATAVEHFNRNRLGSALTLFDLAERLLRSSELSSFEKTRIRSSARAQLRMERFQALLGEPDKHPELRRILSFFPDLRVEALVRRLLKEENRRHRHFIMELLRIHGGEAREAVADILVSSTTLAGREWPWFFVRNLIRILRDVPADESAMSEFELKTVVSYAEPTHAIQVVREAVAYLGTVQNPRAIEALIRLFYSYVDDSRKLREGAGADLARIQSMTLTYLLRASNPNARSTALDYLLSSSRWKNANAQILSVLGSVNLASDPSLDRLLRAIRMRLRGQGLAGKIQALRLRLPQEGWKGRIRGFGRAKEAVLQALIQALSGTPTPEVARLLSEIEELEPTEAIARLARKTRTSLEEMALQVDPESDAALSGDLEIFGLPNIIQSLYASQASGALTIEATGKDRKAVIRVLRGRFVDARVGDLRGEEAFFLLMERPLASTFRFIVDAEIQTAKRPREPKPLLLEGMRRRDEFERLRLLVPDEMTYEVGDGKPSAPADEGDALFVRGLWSAVKEGAVTPELCEQRGLADPYRTRKMLLHWVDTGVLRPVESAAES